METTPARPDSPALRAFCAAYRPPHVPPAATNVALYALVTCLKRGDTPPAAVLAELGPDARRYAHYALAPFCGEHNQHRNWCRAWEHPEGVWEHPLLKGAA